MHRLIFSMNRYELNYAAPKGSVTLMNEW